MLISFAIREDITLTQDTGTYCIKIFKLRILVKPDLQALQVLSIYWYLPTYVKFQVNLHVVTSQM